MDGTHSSLRHHESIILFAAISVAAQPLPLLFGIAILSCLILSQDATSKDNPAYGTSGITFVSMIITYYLLLSIRF